MSLFYNFKTAAIITTACSAALLSRSQIISSPVIGIPVQLPAFPIPPVTLNISSNNYAQRQVNLAFTNNLAGANYDVTISSPYYKGAFELGSPSTMSLNLSPSIAGVGEQPFENAIVVNYTSHRPGFSDKSYSFAVEYDASGKIYIFTDSGIIAPTYNYGTIQSTNSIMGTYFPTRNKAELRSQISEPYPN